MTILPLACITRLNKNRPSTVGIFWWKGYTLHTGNAVKKLKYDSIIIWKLGDADDVGDGGGGGGGGGDHVVVIVPLDLIPVAVVIVITVADVVVASVPCSQRGIQTHTFILRIVLSEPRLPGSLTEEPVVLMLCPTRSSERDFCNCWNKWHNCQMMSSWNKSIPLRNILPHIVTIETEHRRITSVSVSDISIEGALNFSTPHLSTVISNSSHFKSISECRS